MSSLFDSFFGFIFWGVAYFRMRRADGHLAFWKENSLSGWLEGILNVVSNHLMKVPAKVQLASTSLTCFLQLIILTGVFFLTVGTYATVDEIIAEFNDGQISGGVFQCASNGI
jgi:hypothetical protein